MVSVMTCGWLMERQRTAATELIANGQVSPSFLKAKIATVNWYLAHIVPEATGLAVSVSEGGKGLYDLNTEELSV